MVKVGDYIKIVDGWATNNCYKNGDILQVIGLSDFEGGGVWVRTKNPSGDGLYGCDRKLKEPYGYVCLSEFEVVKKKIKPYKTGVDFKIGDSFKIVDNPLEYGIWSELRRNRRKEYIKLLGKTDIIKDIKLCKLRDKNNQMIEKVCVISDNMNGLIIPIDLIEKTERKRIYTEAEIKEAQQIIGKIVATIDDCVDLYFDTRGIRTKAYIHDNIIGEAVCLPDDEFNTTIGRMVALCYATGTRLPKWVY